MNEALKTLSSSGTTGAIMAVILGLLSVVIGVLVRMLWKLFDKNIEADKRREDKYGEFMTALTASLNALTMNFQATRTDSLAAIRDTQTNLLTGIQQIIWLSHDKSKADRKEMVEFAIEKLSGEITGAANSIRASNEKMMTECEKQRLNDEKQRLREENDELSRPHHVDDAAPRKVR
jgi:DNA anti-recombination protein RmuC